MRTLFATGFQISRQPWTSRDPSGVYLGGSQLGRPLSASEIDAYTAKITNGRAKLAQLRAWIAARIDADPMLAKGFNDPVVQKNFWDFMDLINKDQYYVDQTWDQLQNPTSADYDISDENLGRTDEWATVIDNTAQGMQFYTNPAGVKPLVTPKPGVPLPGMLPGVQPGLVRPGVTPMPQAPQPMVLGIPQNTFLIGAGVLGVGLLIAALA